MKTALKLMNKNLQKREESFSLPSNFIPLKHLLPNRICDKMYLPEKEEVDFLCRRLIRIL
jgi:hypothetical protein